MTETSLKHHRDLTAAFRNINKASPTQDPHITHTAPHTTETSRKHRKTYFKTSPTIPKQHRDITETSPQHLWDTTVTKPKQDRNITKASPWHHRDITETSPKRHWNITETSAKHYENETETPPWHPETSPKQRKTKTNTSRRQDRDTTESMNFSILKPPPSTYGSQLDWFAQRCTIYKFKLEFEILLRNPIKMFINVHHQTIKTPSPKQKNINDTTPSHQPLIIINITAPSPHIMETSPNMPEMSPTRHWNISKTPPKNQQNHIKTTRRHQQKGRDKTETSQRHHQNNTETSLRHHRNVIKTSPRHHSKALRKQDRDITMTPLNNTETSPKHHRDIPETSVKHHENKTETPPWHPETSPKQRKTKTDTSRRQDRDTTESMNFSILKLSPSTYGSQLHWFAKRCTIYTFKSEFEILLRNPIKMFINVHHQTTKHHHQRTQTALHQRDNTKPSPTHHQNITAPSTHITAISPKHARDVTNTSKHLKHHPTTYGSATLVCPKVHNIRIQIGIWDFA